MDTKIFPSRLTLAIPKQDKLKTPVAAFLQSKGFALEEDKETGILFDLSSGIPNIRLEFVRATDALLLMERQVVDMAIIGSDVVAENTGGATPRFATPQSRLDLGVAECAFQMAVPTAQAQNFTTPAALNGLRIATSYPVLLEKWLQENNVTPREILVRDGGVESSIRMGLADAVADLVDTGGTLRRNKLTAVFDIARTSAVCYARPNGAAATDILVREFIRRLQPVQSATVQATPSLNYAAA